MDQNTFVVVGLGNTGSRYTHTRHNIGSVFLQEVVENIGITLQYNKKLGHIGWHTHEAGRTAVFFPECFMNESGVFLRSFVQKNNIPLENICVVHDELERKVGSWAMKKGGSARGHNGLKSIMAHVGKDFWRLGLGIDHPKNKGLDDVSAYVLSCPSPEDRCLLQEVFSGIQLKQDFLLQGRFHEFLR